MPASVEVAKVMISPSFWTLSFNLGIAGPDWVSSSMCLMSMTHMAEPLGLKEGWVDHITAGNNLSRNWHVNQDFP